jgi:hypothetical protein
VTITDVSELRGLWRRSLIAWPDGARDATTSVRWLQGLRACIDLRQPADAADFSRVRARGDLSIDQCAWLATQQGFAGHCTLDGSYFEWTRTIDFQPRAPWADAGSLCWEGGVLVETGRDIAYVEHWQRDAAAPTLPVGAVTLRATDENTAAALLRVGPLFMFARDRAVVPAAHRTLGECVAAAPTLRHAQELVDCEISFGDARSAGFRITASSLPYRLGDALDPHLARERLTTTDRAADGTALVRHWDITGSEGELDALQHADLTAASARA